MKYKPISNEEIKNSHSYIITNIVLSQKEGFTPDDIINVIQKDNKITVSISLVKRIIHNLYNNAILYEQLGEYFVRKVCMAH